MSSFFELFYLNNLVTNGDCSPFTKTPKDKEPDSIRNKLVWRIMLLSKEDMFDKADKICIYKNNNFTVYFISGLMGPYRNTAYIIRHNIQNSIVVLQSDIDIDKFLEIVASIKQKEE